MNLIQEHQYEYTPLTFIRGDRNHRSTWGPYQSAYYDQYNSTDVTWEYSNSNDIKLPFLLPLIVILVCICVSSRCPPRAHPIEPLDLDELDVIAEGDVPYSKRLKRARIKKALEDNDVLMVVKESDIKSMACDNEQDTSKIQNSTLQHETESSADKQEATEPGPNNTIYSSDVTGKETVETDIENGGGDGEMIIERAQTTKSDEGNIRYNSHTEGQGMIKTDINGYVNNQAITVAKRIAKALSSYLSDDKDDLLILPRRVPPQTDSVPIMCAICFEAYKPGDTVAWSNNNLCIHCFHLDCIVHYLEMVKGRRIPCPTCRQTFTTLTVKTKTKTKQSNQQQRAQNID